MNKDALISILTKVVLAAATGVLGSSMSQADATSIASGAIALAAFLYGVYQHYGMRKVPQGAVVTAIAPTVKEAKAQSIPAAK